MLRKSFLLGMIMAGAVITSCSPDDDVTVTENTDDTTTDVAYDIPTTYNFDNVSYSGQTERLDMLAEMTTLMKTGNTKGTSVDAATLKKMFANEDDPFSFTSSKQLKNKCESSVQTDFEDAMDALGVASMSTVDGANGTAGVITSKDGAKKYLFDENGIEFTQIIEKGLMGSVFYYQMTSVYLSDDKIGDAVDNTTPVDAAAGKNYTALQHHWDEAFGYFGAPIDFPTNTDGIRFWAKYCNSRDGVLGSNAIIMNAFIKGRAAINNNDRTTMKAQVAIIRTEMERVVAATAMDYLKDGKASLGDSETAIALHEISEAYAFLFSLKFNPEKVITTAKVDELLDKFGDNMHELSTSTIDEIYDELSTIYGITL